MLRRLIAPLALALALAAPASAAAATADVVDLLGARVAKAREASGIRVLLPDRLRTLYDGRLYPGGSWRMGAYSLELHASRGCNGANVCFIADFLGRDGGRPAGDVRVELAKGRTGRFTRSRCAASCGPAVIEWRDRGATYAIEVKGLDAERRDLERMANQAIRAGAR